MDGKGVKNENVTDYRYALVESDTMEPAYIQTCITALDASGADIAYTNVQGIDAHGYKTGVYVPPSVITLDTMRGGWDAAGQFTGWGQWVAEAVATGGLLLTILRAPEGKALAG